EVRALVGREQPAEPREPERRLALAAAERGEDGTERRPEVAVPVVLRAAQRALPETSHPVPLRIERADLGRCPRRVQDVPLLDGEEEDHPVYEPEELVVVLLRRERAGRERASERGVVGGQEPLPEGEERLFDAVAEQLSGAAPLLRREVAP